MHRSIFMTRVLALLATLLTSVAAPGVAAAQDSKLKTLLEAAPPGTNSIAYLNPPVLGKLMSEAKMAESLSVDVHEVWLASEMDVASMNHQWEAGFAKLGTPVRAETLAKQLQGYVDRIGERQVIWTPKQSYLVPDGPDQLGFLRPAKRAMLADWLAGSKRSTPPSYLLEKSIQPEEYLSLFIAIDLTNIFSPIALAERLADYESLKGIDIRSAAESLASIRGISLIVGRRSLSDCMLSVDFGRLVEDIPKPLLAAASRFLLEMLNRNGTAAPEVANWTVDSKGGTLVFRGPISEDSLHAVLGIFSLPQQAEDVAASQKPQAIPPAAADTPAPPRPGEPTDPSEPNVYASKEYFDNVLELVERVRKYDAKTSGYRARWNDRQARRIDELPTLGVDPGLIQYGSDTANLLRNNALNIRGGNIEASQTKANQSLAPTSTFGGYYGGFYGGFYGSYSGWYDPNNRTDYQRVTDVQAFANATIDYNTTLGKIDQLTGEIRRVMTQKYKTQF
jgi:hypothetical protein